MLSLMERTELIFKEIFLVDSRLKQLGIEAECVLQETKQMYVEVGEEKSKEVIKLESTAIKAKQGILCNEDNIKCTSPKRCMYWTEVTVERPPTSAHSITLLVTASSTFRKGAAPARGVA